MQKYKERCPACDAPSMYDKWLDRYFHKDGSNNQPCWQLIAESMAIHPSNT